MKGDCKIKKLGDVCDVINGLWTGKKEPFINICVIRNTNFTKDCKLNLDDVAYIDAEVKQFSTRKLQIGDIIVEKSGGSDKQPVGRVVLFDVRQGDYSFSNFTSALRVKGDVVPKYLHKCLVAHYRRGETEKLQSKTTGIRNLDMKGYLRLPIPIRPLPEQERIVAELDCLSGAIEKQKQQLKELDNLAQAIFYDMFGDPITNEKGWKVKPLGDACGFQQGEQVPIEEQFEVYEEGMVRFLRIVDFTQGNEKPRYVMCKNTKHILQNEQVAIVRYGTPGFVCFGKSGLIANNLFKIIPKSEDIAFRFLVYWLYSDAFQSVIKDNQYGVALQAIKFSTIKDINLIIPPINLQREFASKIEAIEKQKELIKQSLSETEILFNSRMDYYFN